MSKDRSPFAEHCYRPYRIQQIKVNAHTTLVRFGDQWKPEPALTNAASKQPTRRKAQK